MTIDHAPSLRRLMPPGSDATGQVPRTPTHGRSARRPACDPQSLLPLPDSDVVHAYEIVRREPAVRGERVARLRQRLAAGTYVVPAALLARRLL